MQSSNVITLDSDDIQQATYEFLLKRGKVPNKFAKQYTTYVKSPLGPSFKLRVEYTDAS